MAAPGDDAVHQLPDAFVAPMRAALGVDELRRLLGARSRPAVRVNTLRTTPDAARRRLDALGVRVERAPFARDAFFVDDPLAAQRPIGTLFEHQAGLFYSQDAASLLAVEALGPQPGERVLDLCAAPGGKTTHIAARMRGEGLVVANEPNPGRFHNMCSNVDRMGCLNVVGTVRDGLRARWTFPFDRVLVDAPCSNLGGIHLNTRAARVYTVEKALRLANLQRALLARAFEATRVGGTIVYSTCTLDPRENEAVASWFLDTHAVELVPFAPGIGRPGLQENAGEAYRPEVVGACRVHPGDGGTDGFFVARFVKRDGDCRLAPARAADASRYEHAPAFHDELVGQYALRGAAIAGATLVRTQKRAFAVRVPELDDVFGLAPERIGMGFAVWDSGEFRLTFDASTALGVGAGTTHELDERDARRWLAGEDVPAQERGTWSVITHRGEPLGCARPFGARLPSFVPKERRVPLDGPERLGFVAESA